MDSIRRLVAFFVVIGPIVWSKVSDQFSLDGTELLSIWIATLLFIYTPKEIKALIELIFSRISKIKSLKGGGFDIDFCADEKIQEVEEKLSKFETNQSSKSHGQDLSSYSKEIFGKIEEKTNLPYEALAEAKKCVIDNIREIVQEKDPDTLNHAPMLSERTLLRVLGNFREVEMVDINFKIKDLIADLNQLSKLEVSQGPFDNDNILYLAELYSRLACVLYGEKIRLRIQSGIPAPKPDKPLAPKGITTSAVSFSENVLYASISIIDSNGRLFPIKQNLDKDNFEIYETRESIQSPPLIVLSVIPTLRTQLPIRIIFVIDNSGSMGSEIPGSSTKKITMAQKSLTHLLDKFSESFQERPDTLLAILTFKGKGCTFLTDPQGNAWSRNNNLLKRNVNGISSLATDGTPLWGH